MTGWMIESAGRDAEALGAAARAGWDAPVRSCPGWTGAHLLAHADGFARYLPLLFAGAVTRRAAAPDVSPDEAAATYADDVAGMLDLLRTTPPDAPVPNWSVRPDVAAFWSRRAAHEFAVHRWDAQLEPDPVPTHVALDGIAEYFEVFAATGIAAGMTPRAAATVVVEPVDGEPSQHHLPDPGPQTILRGTASDLFLALWHRRDPLDLFVSGDRGIIADWPRI